MNFPTNGETAAPGLTPVLIVDLRAYLDGMPPGSQVFSLPEQGAEMIQFDLAAAGIPYRDEAELYFDFHALRCQFATLLDQAGVSPRIVQKKMRHSTLELTNRYTRPRDQELEGTTTALPNLGPDREAPRASADAAGEAGTGPISEDFAAHLPHGGDAAGRELADGGGMGGPDAEKE